MKKLFIFSFILAVTMGMIYSQSIVVTSPSGGTWYKGSTHNITWTATGCSSSSYKINIFKNSITEANFVEQLTKTGTPTKSWTIPMGYTNGTYYIRIKTDPAQTGCQGDSAAFQITDEPTLETSTIIVTHPTAGEVFCRGEGETISWTTTGTISGTVKINIFNGPIDPANFVTQLTATTSSGSKIWNVPAGQTLGTNYHVRVKEATLGTTSGDSPAFTVADCESGGSGPGLDPGMIEKIKDLMRRLERIPWWRNPKGPWPGPGPGPCLSCPVFDLQKLRDLLEEAELKEEIGVALYNGGQKMADFGKFTPPSRFVGKGLKLKRLRGMKVMQSRVGLKSIKMEHTKMLSRGTGFKLVFMNSKGAIIGDFGVKLEEKLMK